MILLIGYKKTKTTVNQLYNVVTLTPKGIINISYNVLVYRLNVL